MQAFAGSTTPTGWLLCDGSAVSRTDYAGLYAVIGDTYGDGDGATTFNLPDLSDKFIEGSATAGTVKNAGLPNITGRISAAGAVAIQQPTSSGAFTTSGGTAYQPTPDNTSTKLPVIVNFSAQDSNSIYGNSSTAQPPALTMKYIIKY